MKLPLSPPPFEQIVQNLNNADNKEQLFRLLSANFGPVDNKGRYLHWDKLRHLQAPEGWALEEYWAALKFARKKLYKNLPFTAKNGEQFRFCLTDGMFKDLHWLDQNASGHIGMDKPVTNPHTRDSYLVSSLIEESISSSQLEGASTTRNVAIDMLRQDRKPQDHGEQMIFNNYHAMQFIREFKSEQLTESMILHLHGILTENTLDAPKKAGKYREAGDDIHVVDATASVLLHTPPDATELPDRVAKLCAFANDTDAKEFIHPVIRAIILHFMIGYDHPFVDGNGRTARALFYWSMANQGYWLMEFISISQIIKQAPAQYGKAYLYSETDENDLTYFIIHQLEVIRKAITALHRYLERKAAEIFEIEKCLEGSTLQGKLNHRQLAILRHALDHPTTIYTIQQHQAAHKLSYQTARTDLLKMADDFHILSKRKYGNTFVFLAPPDLGQRLSQMEARYAVK
ncbi:filamentation induced by cAMP protein fic [Methylomonas koyamae]|uniref:Filamentation induced by cAMP protein fic n=1 Tax=Methylomonas koyamae TaxID=702114 RepID=A0A177N2D9_9GAMM|nr:Fic family protein [Methylomonas koyamae]OAI11814.1 filamentation induced by cAMP protein fic [Methylomonas koyamae]